MTDKTRATDPFRQTGWPGLRAQAFPPLFPAWRRPMTLGVRGLVYDRAEQVGVPDPPYLCAGLAIARRRRGTRAKRRPRRWSASSQEEGNILFTAPPVLKSLHFNRGASRRDHVAFYLIEAFRQTAPKLPDREIAEAGFFPLDACPTRPTPATLRRIAEVFAGEPVSPYW